MSRLRRRRWHARRQAHRAGTSAEVRRRAWRTGAAAIAERDRHVEPLERSAAVVLWGDRGLRRGRRATRERRSLQRARRSSACREQSVAGRSSGGRIDLPDQLRDLSETRRRRRSSTGVPVHVNAAETDWRRLIDVLRRQREIEDHIVADSTRGELTHSCGHMHDRWRAEVPSCRSRMHAPRAPAPNSQHPTSTMSLGVGSWRLGVGRERSFTRRQQWRSHDVACREITR